MSVDIGGVRDTVLVFTWCGAGVRAGVCAGVEFFVLAVFCCSSLLSVVVIVVVFS